MRYSRQRELVLKSIVSSKKHPTAECVLKKVRKNMPSISFGTVYRNLNQLTEQGTIRMIQLNGVARYDGNMNPHNHFVCDKCHEIYDIQILGEDFISEVEIKNNHHVTHYHLEARGICKNCKCN